MIEFLGIKGEKICRKSVLIVGLFEKKFLPLQEIIWVE
jgi:hypothetical protein